MDNLGPLTGAIRSHSIVGFDVETVQSGIWMKWGGEKVPAKKQEFYLGSVVWNSSDGTEEVATFFDKREMARFLLDKQFRGARIFATNLAFDLTEVFYPFGKDWELLFNGSQLILAKYLWNERNRICFYDTTNINRYMSVAQMGDSLGFEKLEKPDFLGKLPTTHAQLDYLKRYNIRDAQISKRYIERFQKIINGLGGVMGATAPSTAMDLWRRKYLDRFIRQPWRWVCEAMYDACYGGRTEVFVRGFSKELRYYDVNSLYPFIMKTIQFPDTDTIHFLENGPFDKNWLLKEGISWIKVRAPADMLIPILPKRMALEENAPPKLVFPVGSFWGAWTHNEIRYALMHGYTIEDWEKTIICDESFNPFKEYVEDLYALRMKWKEAGDKAEEVVKLMMNSLFGKFGQKISGKGGTYKSLDQVKSIAELDGKEICGDFLVEPREFFPVYVIPILAAYITAGARVHLHQLMSSVGHNRIYYCDTDSIITDAIFNTSSKLGDLKLEMEIEKFWAFKPKFYRAIGIDTRGKPKDVARCKGIPTNRMDFFVANGFHSGTFKVEMDKMLKFREAIRRETKPNTIILDFVKRMGIDSANDKRVGVSGQCDLLTENQSTQPIFIDERIYIPVSH